MTSTHILPHSYRTVVGFDFSTQAVAALERAIGMSAEVPGSAIHIVCAIGNSPNATFPNVEHTYQGADQVRERVRELADQVVIATDPAGLTVYVHARIGEPAPTILQVSAEVRADLIVVGTHSKSGLSRWVLGSVSDRVVRQANCPVVVMRETDYDSRWSLQHLPEPPCPACVQQRANTGGREWWCERHTKRDPPYVRPIFGVYERDQSQRRRDAWVLY